CNYGPLRGCRSRHCVCGKHYRAERKDLQRDELVSTLAHARWDAFTTGMDSAHKIATWVFTATTVNAISARRPNRREGWHRPGAGAYASSCKNTRPAAC